jgi:hypothetical protein
MSLGTPLPDLRFIAVDSRGAHRCPQSSHKKEQPNRGPRPTPRGPSASAIQAGRDGRGQRPATRDAGGSAKADRKRRTSPEPNTHEPTDTAASATDAPTKRTKAARTEHTASHRERGQPCTKAIREPGNTMRAKGIRITGIHMKCQAHTGASRRGRRSHRSAQRSAGSGQPSGAQILW